MDIQNKEALIAEIEQFKEEALKMHIVQVLADSYTNTNLFDYNIDSDSSVIWYKAQARQLWDFWQAKAQVPEGFGDIQSWIAVNSFSALDASIVDFPVVDANELAEFIDSLNIDVAVPEGFVLVPKEPTEEMIMNGLLVISTEVGKYDIQKEVRMIWEKMIEAQEQKG